MIFHTNGKCIYALDAIKKEKKKSNKTISAEIELTKVFDI